jgi:hypothetical protein
MPDLSNLNIVLLQTKVVERLQEGSRRRGEIEQQQLTRKLEDMVDIRGRQVDETPEPREGKVDPDAKGEAQGRPTDLMEDDGQRGEQDPSETGSVPEDDTDSLSAEEGKGRVIDVKA